MMSFAADLILLVALVATAVSMVAFQRRLKRLDGLNGEYRVALAQASAALSAASQSLVTFNDDGRKVLVLLAGRIDNAHEIIAQIDARARAHRLRNPN